MHEGVCICTTKRSQKLNVKPFIVCLHLYFCVWLCVYGTCMWVYLWRKHCVRYSGTRVSDNSKHLHMHYQDSSLHTVSPFLGPHWSLTSAPRILSTIHWTLQLWKPPFHIRCLLGVLWLGALGQTVLRYRYVLNLITVICSQKRAWALHRA